MHVDTEQQMEHVVSSREQGLCRGVLWPPWLLPSKAFTCVPTIQQEHRSPEVTLQDVITQNPKYLNDSWAHQIIETLPSHVSGIWVRWSTYDLVAAVWEWLAYKIDKDILYSYRTLALPVSSFVSTLTLQMQSYLGLCMAIPSTFYQYKLLGNTRLYVAYCMKGFYVHFHGGKTRGERWD